MPGDFDFFNDDPKAKPAPKPKPPAPRPAPPPATLVEDDEDAGYDEPAPARPAARRPRVEPLDEPERPRYQPRGSAPKWKLSPLLIGGIALAAVVLIGGVVGVVLAVGGGKARPTEPKDKGSTVVANTTTTRPAVTAKKEQPVDQNTPSTETVEKVKKATLRVLVLMNDGKGSSGSGFVEKDTMLVLTNAHVVGMKKPTDPRPKAINLVVNSGEGDKEYKLRGDLLAVDTDNDLAVIKPGLLEVGGRHVVPDGLVVPRASNVSLLQKLFVFGFPLGSELGKEITVSDVSVTSLRKDTDGRLNKIQVKGGMTHGNSGGPVVDVKGNVIGVAVSGIKETDINFCVPGEMVQQLLAKRNEWKD